MKQVCKILVSSYVFFMSAVIFADQLPSNYVHGELIVKMKNRQELPELAVEHQSKELFPGMYWVKSSHIEMLKRELSLHHENVEYVQNNNKRDKRDLNLPGDAVRLPRLIQTPFFNDPKVNNVWSFKSANRYGISVNDYYDRYGQDADRQEVIVAVVDTGVDYNHEELRNVMWTNEDEIPGNGVDDDNNGYVDDIHGINTLIRDAHGEPTSEIMDTHSHGTHVSGTIAAEQNNNIGFAGIAASARIMGIRTVPNNGDETDRDVVESYIYAAKNGARIINCSFGKDLNEDGLAVSDAIDFIHEEYDVLVVTSAGNSSQDIDVDLTYPASFQNDNMIVIAATTDRGNRSWFSNYGHDNVDVAAPGSDIYSSTPGNNYDYFSGTSMASPTTSGMAAELLSRFPEMTALELKKLIMDSVTPVTEFEELIGSGGRIDLLRAYEAKINQ